MGHAVSASFGSRMTPGYAHVSWDSMVRAVHSLEQPAPTIEKVFSSDSGKIPSNSVLAQKPDDAENAIVEGNSDRSGRHERTRTADPYRVKVVLYQLSYVPKGESSRDM